MRQLSIFSILTVGFALSFSCTTPDRSQELQLIDSLQQIAVSYADSLQNPIFDSVAIVTAETQAKSDTLLEIYRDSTDRIFWVENFSDYARLHKKSDEFQKELKAHTEAWDLSITQLDHLKTDIENNAIDFETAGLYIQNEIKAIETQRHDFRTLKGRVENYLSVYHRTKPIIEDRLARLKGETDEDEL